MAAPPKPWESAGVNRQSPEGPDSSLMSSQPPTSVGSAGLGTASAVFGSDPPPIPSRPTQQTGGNSTFGSGYGSYGAGYSSPYSMGYGGAGGGGGGLYSSPYSSMYGGGAGGGYGGGMGYNNRLGYGQGNDYNVNSFARQAEESSRPAFQSIESIVGAFSSVSMMLDSTFQAVYSSFRAVIGVADNFSRMKTQFAQIFSAFAVFRTLRYLYRKLLVLLRLRPQGYAEDAWTEAGDAFANVSAASGPPGRPRKSSWPVLMFMAIVFGGPYLIWKFLRTTFANEAGAPGWANGIEDHFVGQALFNFQGDSTEELSFQVGQNIHVAPKELQPRMKGWLLACVDGKTIGILPANYVKILGKRRGRGVQTPGLTDPQGQSNPNVMPSTSAQANDFSQSVMGGQGLTNIPNSDPSLESVFENPSDRIPPPAPSAGVAFGTENMDAEDILDQS